MENTGTKPGQTIAPQTAVAPISANSASPAPAAAPLPIPALLSDPASAPEPVMPSSPLVATSSTFPNPNPEPSTSIPTGLERPPETEERAAAEEITWTASEFIAHEKSAGWYAALALVMLVAAGAIYLITKDIVSVVVVIVGSIMLGVYAARQPRQLEFGLDNSGISIGQRHYNYSEFRSFAIVSEGAFSSIVLMPLKRFATYTTIYYSPEDEEKIVNILSDRLPFEEHTQDVVDRLMRRIRF